ncbi:MAG: TIGR02710 family CRISPR-associated protein [Clostridia bacterium]|nr:TIGR02710 family CRISPR-associated protein [Clostridia bacterium]
MMVLAITVGGAPTPVIRSITNWKPDHVVFFGSTDPKGGSVRLITERTEAGPSIVEATKLAKDQYTIVPLSNPDDLEGCFEIMLEKLSEAEERFKPTEKLADYTGGTKSMNAALVLAALFLGWDLALVTGPRGDLEKVRDGTETPMRVNTANIKAAFLLPQIKALYEAHQYSAAAIIVQDILRLPGLSFEQQQNFLNLNALLQALSRWEMFRYPEAKSALSPLNRFFPELTVVLADLAETDEDGKPSYNHVADLLENARRRAEEGRFDDAIIRLYRAIEFLAQARLLAAYGIDAGNVDLSKVPEPLAGELRSRAREGKPVDVGLFDAFRILSALNDPVGKLFREKWEDRIKDLLGLRNKSILIHGYRAATEEEWNRAHAMACAFLEEAAKTLRIKLVTPEFPSWKEIPWT